jgi:hypothetical protein
MLETSPRCELHLRKNGIEKYLGDCFVFVCGKKICARNQREGYFHSLSGIFGKIEPLSILTLLKKR